MIINLNGKIGLIIGIANEHSIAYGCAKKFYEEGAELAITFQNQKAEPYVRPLAEKLQSPLIVPCDVQKQDELGYLFECINKKWGKLDFILHSIAFAPKADLQGRIVACSKEGFLQAMDISCYSFIQLSKLAEPLLKKGGSLLTMTYYGSQKVIVNYDLMGIVKAALEATTRYLACALGKQNIRVNAISPGAIPTRAASGIKDFSNYLKDGKEKSPLNSLVDIEDVGNLAAFLVSDASNKITGQIYYIDSGCSIVG